MTVPEIHLHIHSGEKGLDLSQPLSRPPKRRPTRPHSQRELRGELQTSIWYRKYMAKPFGREGYQSWKAYKAARIAYDNGEDVELGGPEMRDSVYKGKAAEGFRAGKGLRKSYIQMTEEVVINAHKMGEREGEEPEMVDSFLDDRLSVVIDVLNIEQKHATQMKSRIYQGEFATIR